MAFSSLFVSPLSVEIAVFWLRRAFRAAFTVGVVRGRACAPSASARGAPARLLSFGSDLPDAVAFTVGVGYALGVGKLSVRRGSVPFSLRRRVGYRRAGRVRLCVSAVLTRAT